MTKHTLRLALAGIALLALLPALAGILSPIFSSMRVLDAARIAAVAGQFPNFSADQKAAMAREVQSELHPAWKTLPLSSRAARLALLTQRLLQPRAAASDAQTLANFQGNLTVINALPGDSIGLQRQSDCSLSLFNGTYTLSLTPTIQILATTPHYELALHTAAGLATQADVFSSGCPDSSVGIGSRRGLALGKISANVAMFAGSGYDPMASSNGLYVGTLNSATQQIQTFSVDVSLPDIGAIAAGDLNGDGLMDVVGLNATGGSISVWLAKSDGTVGTPTVYTLPGTATEAAVVADVNGDGKADVIVATIDGSAQERISVLTGNGNGTLNAAQSFTIATPASKIPLATLIAADLRATGHLDLVGSNGTVLLNNGTGAFTAGAAAFTGGTASSNYGPNLAAADFNKDGKLDLAVGNGATIDFYLGNGDGTFTSGKSYAGIGDVGYLTATDLDGDGNIDVYVGLANGGFFGGDQFEVNQAYALMGNGDGSFQGAPNVPFAYTGGNIVDLNGDKSLDVVSASGASFVSYLGDGKGNFTAAHTLNFSPVTVGGTSYTLGLDSSAIGDVNGDGVPDLAYIAPAPNGIPDGTGGTGVFVALGDGHGGFGAPTFYGIPTAPSSITGNNITYPKISNLHLADVNHDGKADLIYYYTYSYENASNTASTNAGTAIQLSNGDGTFQAPQLIVFYQGADLLVSSSNGISDGIPYTSYVELVSDLNKDGNPDLIYITDTQIALQPPYSSVPAIQVALGHGDGTFSTPIIVSGPTQIAGGGSGIPAPLAVRDMNGDGIPDIIALGSSSGADLQVAVALGNGDGSFKAPLLTNYTAQYLNSFQGLAVADFNGDGKLDVVITDPYDPAGSGISLGNGDGTLQTFSGGSLVEPTLGIALGLQGAPFAADFNGDGKADVLVGNTLLLSQASTAATTIGTTTTLTSSAATIATGASLALNAKVVASSGTATPTGNVTFLDGTATLGVVALAADGTAALTTSSLAAGSHNLTVSYAGTASFAASSSAATTVVVGAAADFGLVLSSAAGTVAPGQSVQTTVTLTPSGGFDQNVALACSGLPVGSSCTFAPASVSVNGAAATSMLTITSTAVAAANSSVSHANPFVPGGLLLAGIGLLVPVRRRRFSTRITRLGRLTIALAGAALMLQSCGGGHASGGSSVVGGTPAGTYTISVSATAGSTTHTASYALTVS